MFPTAPPWNCDYHLNINLQMNYWPAEVCNLAECAEPLMRGPEDLREPGEKTAKVHYDSRGWVVHHVANVWGFTAPGSNRGIHMLEAENAAFLCNNVWAHYAFTQDKDFLYKTAWPLMKVPPSSGSITCRKSPAAISPSRRAFHPNTVP